jgi:multiple sugar transport system ATP-binding protein
MATVKLEKITRRFNKMAAIADISFTVPDGELWVLVGPSGCGKSTILRTIAGLESITEGKLYFDNTLVNQIPARQRDVAMVFQNYALYPHLTVGENLGFGLKMRGVDKRTITDKVESVARSLNIDRLLTRKPKQLSGGQQQRVALGRAIIRKPKVFLLDEPLSNLDAQLRDETRTELKQLHAQVEITTIYVTHDQVEAMTLADKIVVLNEGIIQQIGTPQEIYNYPANRMVATFLGSPPMNILPVTYLEGKFRVNSQQSLPVNSEILEQIHPQPGQGFDLGIRPEFITVLGENEAGVQDNIGRLTATIDIVEPLGREILVRAMIVGSQSAIYFHTHARWTGKRGDRLNVGLDLNHLFLFEPSSGALSHHNLPKGHG